MDDLIMNDEDLVGDARAQGADEFNRAQQSSSSSDHHRDDESANAQHENDNLEQEGSQVADFQDGYQSPRHGDVNQDPIVTSKSFASAVAKLFAKQAGIKDRMTQNIQARLQHLLQGIDAAVSAGRQAQEKELAEQIDDDNGIKNAVAGRKRTSTMANDANRDSSAEA